jgi:hypothetical protein
MLKLELRKHFDKKERAAPPDSLQWGRCGFWASDGSS